MALSLRVRDSDTGHAPPPPDKALFVFVKFTPLGIELFVVPSLLVTELPTARRDDFREKRPLPPPDCNTPATPPPPLCMLGSVVVVEEED